LAPHVERLKAIVDVKARACDEVRKKMIDAEKNMREKDRAAARAMAELNCLNAAAASGGGAASGAASGGADGVGGGGGGGADYKQAEVHLHLLNGAALKAKEEYLLASEVYQKTSSRLKNDRGSYQEALANCRARAKGLPV